MPNIRRELARYNSFSQDLFKEANLFASASTVGLVGHAESNKRLDGVYGSGSLVVINSKYGVLTAKHVWKMFERNGEVTKISFSVLGYPHYIHEQKLYLTPYFPDNDVDICFIELTSKISGTIKACRNIVFFSIDERKQPNIEKIKENVLVTVGFPAENQPSNHETLNILRYYTHSTDYVKIDEIWDIIELDVEDNNSSGVLPRTFGGMSGGGVWSFNILFNDDSGEKKYWFENKDALLVGVNFYETVDGERRKIRAVGPNSIYKGMLNLVKNRF
jgi:hypothetical protein